MLSAYITHPDCARHEMGPHHPECPERLGAIQDHLLVKGLLDYMLPHDAPLATEEQLSQAHSSLYIKELLAASPTEGYYALDPDTNMNPYTIKAALRAAACACLKTTAPMPSWPASGPACHPHCPRATWPWWPLCYRCLPKAICRPCRCRQKSSANARWMCWWPG